MEEVGESVVQLGLATVYSVISNRAGALEQLLLLCRYCYYDKHIL